MAPALAGAAGLPRLPPSGPAPKWPVALGAAAAVPGWCLPSLSQVSNSMGPLNQWPDGHRIMAASSGPSLESMVNRDLTSAGSPHRRVPSWSR
jgi:hypothetical protein